MKHTDQILSLFDSGKYAPEIAETLILPRGHVYAVLRKHRPNRSRKPRERTSDLPRIIKGLAAEGYHAPRVAFLLGVSKAYVYRHWPTA